MVSKFIFSALTCDNLKEDGKHLVVDYRVQCDSPHWQVTIRITGWIGVAVWPIGFPLLCIIMLYIHDVPGIAKRKAAEAVRVDVCADLCVGMWQVCLRVG